MCVDLGFQFHVGQYYIEILYNVLAGNSDGSGTKEAITLATTKFIISLSISIIVI